MFNFRSKSIWKREIFSFLVFIQDQNMEQVTIHTFQTGRLPGGPCKRKVRREWIILARGKALVCETLPYVEEISRNATILGVHATSHGENDKGNSFDGRSMYVGWAGFPTGSKHYGKYVTAATTSVGGGRFTDIEDIACKSPEMSSVL